MDDHKMKQNVNYTCPVRYFCFVVYKNRAMYGIIIHITGFILRVKE